MHGEVAAANNRARGLIRNLERQRERERREAEAAARRERREQERAVLEEARAEVFDSVRQMSFGQAVEQWRSRTDDLQVESTKAEAAAVRDVLTWLDGVKAFIGREARNRSYSRARAQLRGDVVDADEAGVSIELAGGVGSFQRTWQQVGARIFTDMASFYLGATSISDVERGRMAAGLALFFHVNDAERPAEGAARNAVQWNAEVEPALRLAVPGLLPETESAGD